MKKEIIELFLELTYKKDIMKIFSEVVELYAIAIKNAVDFSKELEQRYLFIIKQYSEEEVNLIVMLIVSIRKTLEEKAQNNDICDILGEVYHELELHSKAKGQFFTPNTVARLVANITINDSVIKSARNKHYIKIAEPSVGSGTMILGAIYQLNKRGINYTKELYCDVNDVDLKCVHMAYIQLSLYGIPAKIYHRDTLTLETWSTWETPVFIIDGWNDRLKYKQNIEVIEIKSLDIDNQISLFEMGV